MLRKTSAMALLMLGLVAAPANAGFRFSAPPPPPPKPQPVQQPIAPVCVTPDHHAFDFWIGEWNVFANGSTTQIATSSIEAMFAGCAIRETWKPLKGGGGGSFSHYDKDRGHWRQVWIDSGGQRVDFDGALKDGAMILTGQAAGAKDKLTRMTFTRNGDGSVRQLGEQSADQGATWTTSFDFIYKPRKAGEK